MHPDASKRISFHATVFVAGCEGGLKLFYFFVFSLASGYNLVNLLTSRRQQQGCNGVQDPIAPSSALYSELVSFWKLRLFWFSNKVAVDYILLQSGLYPLLARGQHACMLWSRFSLLNGSW